MGRHTDIPEAEARALLKPGLRVVDAEWKIGVSASSFEAGVLDPQGRAISLLCVLKVLHAPGTFTTWTFTVFDRKPYGTERVFQLQVRQLPRLPKDKHQHPDEHMGDRKTRHPERISWGFSECMARFVEATGICFDPELDDPTKFKLT